MQNAISRLALLLAFTIACAGWAGAQPLKRSCASHDYYLKQMAAHPEMRERRAAIERFTRDYLLRQPAQKTTGPAVYHIPVVVHVLYKTTVQNISDAQVFSQINILNQDFRKLNADTGQVPTIFKSLTADCEIDFCLAQRDPQGNPTNGIVRKATSKSSFDAGSDEAKFNSTGGDNAWPAGDYLNIWVVPAITWGSDQLLGYAQFPGGPAATDGVVIGYNFFGNTGAVSAPFNKGRTATHEVGHWLNLYHIWGDDGSACSGSDEVGDTPNQADENYGCPAFPRVSCSNSSSGGDMFMNYMDYTDDACMYLFTNGQKTRMHAVLTSGGARASLSASQGCVPVVAAACPVPAGATAVNIGTGSALLRWKAVAAAGSYTLQWKAATAATWNTVSALTDTAYLLGGLSAGTSYQYRVRATCGVDSSLYSAAFAFTTATGCSDVYEPNGTKASAAVIPANTTVVARIGTATDKDYYKFSTTAAAPKVKLYLSNLPADYDIKLYRGSALVGTSQVGGSAPETIVYNYSAAATYTVYVYGYSGAYSASQCYNLQVQSSASSFRELPEQSVKTAASGLLLFPNPASREAYFDLAADENGEGSVLISDQAGRVVQMLPVQVEEGQNRIRLDLRGMASGFYIVKLVLPGAMYTGKLVVTE